MQKRWIWALAKLLEGVGLVVVLAGLLWSVNLGMQDDGLGSMRMEFQGLAVGGGLFLLGWFMERAVSAR